jgi:hypothetical protein
MKSTFQQRFKELYETFKKLPIQRSSYDNSNYYSGEVWRKWTTSAESLILAVFGESSPHYKNFVKTKESCDGSDYRVMSVFGEFDSAKEAFEGGYVFDVTLTISGEVLGDFVSLARESLQSGHKDVAAVLACSALEDALKRYSIARGLDVSGKTMNEVVNALKSARLVGGAQKSLLDTMPKIRNMAMHADWDKISEPDVNSVLGYVEQFLLSKLS